MSDTHRLAICVFATGLSAFPAAGQGASGQFWPELGIYVQQGEIFRFGFVDSASSNASTHTWDGNFTLYLEAALKPVFRRELRDQPDVYRNRYLTFRSGYRHRTSLTSGSTSENRGILDLLTWHGVRVRFPGEARRRERLGKFYHRPPGGESWVDVALRLRSLRDSIAREHEGKRVMIVSHEVPILIMRYLVEDLTEHEVLAFSGSIPNCSLTRYVFDDEGHPHADLVGWCVPLTDEGVEVTEAPERPVAPR